MQRGRCLGPRSSGETHRARRCAARSTLRTALGLPRRARQTLATHATRRGGANRATSHRPKPQAAAARAPVYQRPRPATQGAPPVQMKNRIIADKPQPETDAVCPQ
ncbi:hypothetical protein GCM10025866_25220 [Naasia aerilata]|uniref:Uncharacterized protein n=1 Tax=Naasia aerilata TaxID=1162966 RepID=A0ABM8GE79_9MICO|nr:hypothetical protein GCM10025866_25220 [Naasia aerilata]